MPLIYSTPELLVGGMVNALIQSAPSAVILVNQHGEIALTNRQCQLLFGYSEEELLGKSVETLIPVRLREMHASHRQNFARQPSARSIGANRYLKGLRSNGSEMNVEIRLTPVDTPNGTFVVVSISDTSEKVRAEERFHSVVEASPNATIMVDANGEIVLANRQTELLFGYQRAELIGQKIELLVPDHIRAQHPALRQSFFLHPQPRPMGAGRDLKGRRKDGTEVSVEIGLNPIETSEGKFVLASIIDITERRKNESLVASQEAAVAASRMKSLFLANMSHEIRTPMNGIMGMTELLLNSPLNDAQRDFAETIQRSADAMLMVVNDILDFSQIEAGKLRLNERAFDLNVVLRDREKIFGQAARKKGITLRLDSPVFAHFLFGDPVRVGQVLNNLVGNAVKFTDQGEVHLRVSSLSDSELLFEVQDSGRGVPDSALAKLFDSFSQAEETTDRRFEGTGLGLAISKRLVELMHGEIGVESRVSEGSRFWFRLPLRAAGAAEVTPSPRRPLGEHPPPSGFRILVAEDNKVNQKLIRAFVELLGHEIRIEPNGRLALNALETEHFDLVLMDCEMPVLSGFQTTREIRQSAADHVRSIPIVAMTAGAIKGDRERCIEAGMDDYISKPIQLHTLKDTLDRWLRRR